MKTSLIHSQICEILDAYAYFVRIGQAVRLNLHWIIDGWSIHQRVARPMNFLLSSLYINYYLHFCINLHFVTFLVRLAIQAKPSLTPRESDTNTLPIKRELSSRPTKISQIFNISNFPPSSQEKNAGGVEHRLKIVKDWKAGFQKEKIFLLNWLDPEHAKF